MKKIITGSLALVFALAAGTAAYAESNLEQRVNAKVQKAVQTKKVSVPQKAKTEVSVHWVDYNVTMKHNQPRYREDGSAVNVMSCSAVLCNYKDEKDAGVVTVAFDKNCFNDVQKWSDAQSFLFEVNLEQFGSYTQGDMEGEPFQFSMEVNKTKEDMGKVFHFVKTKSGNGMYLFNMPIRTAEAKASLKNFFAKNGSVSREAAANALKGMPKPNWDYQFTAD